MRLKQKGIEYSTFSDWTTEQRGDTITFIVVDGEVTGIREKVEDDVRGGFDI